MIIGTVSFSSKTRADEYAREMIERGFGANVKFNPNANNTPRGGYKYRVLYGTVNDGTAETLYKKGERVFFAYGERARVAGTVEEIGVNAKEQAVFYRVSFYGNTSIFKENELSK